MDLTKLYLEHKNQIFNFVYYKVRNVEASEEIVNDSFLKAYKYFDNEKSAFYTFLQNVANTLIIDYWRSENDKKFATIRISNFVDDDGKEKMNYGFSPAADELVNKLEDQKRIASAFRLLKPKYRKVAILFFLRELKYIEIVEKTGLDLGTVKGQLFRARKQLQTELG